MLAYHDSICGISNIQKLFCFSLIDRPRQADIIEHASNVACGNETKRNEAKGYKMKIEEKHNGEGIEIESGKVEQLANRATRNRRSKLTELESLKDSLREHVGPSDEYADQLAIICDDIGQLNFLRQAVGILEGHSHEYDKDGEIRVFEVKSIVAEIVIKYNLADGLDAGDLQKVLCDIFYDIVTAFAGRVQDWVSAGKHPDDKPFFPAFANGIFWELVRENDWLGFQKQAESRRKYGW